LVLGSMATSAKGGGNEARWITGDIVAVDGGSKL
jgi:hypothetical protein